MAKENPEQKLSRAIADGDADVITQLLSDGVINVNRRDVTHDMQTLLMRLCHVGLPENALQDVLSVMEEATADVNATDNMGRTPLMHACIARHVFLAKYLLSRDCDVTKRDRTRDNCLHYAVRSGCKEIVEEILLREGVASLVSERNNAGLSPLGLCRQQRCKAMLSMLQCHVRGSDSAAAAGGGGGAVDSQTSPPQSPRKLPPTFPHPTNSESPAPARGNPRTKGRNPAKSECAATVGRSVDGAASFKGGDSTQGKQLAPSPLRDGRLMVLRSMSDGVDKRASKTRSSMQLGPQGFSESRDFAAHASLARATMFRQSSDQTSNASRAAENEGARSAEERSTHPKGELFPKIDQLPPLKPQGEAENGEGHRGRRDSISLPDLRNLKNLIDPRGEKSSAAWSKSGSAGGEAGDEDDVFERDPPGVAPTQGGVKLPRIDSLEPAAKKTGQAPRRKVARKLSSSDEGIYAMS